IGETRLSRFRSGSEPLDRELAIALADLNPPGTIGKLVAELNVQSHSREHQIFLVYCLRTIERGWTAEDFDSVVAWFEKTQAEGWKGGASFFGYLQLLWQDILRWMPPEQRLAAEQRIPSLNPPELEPGEAPLHRFRRENYTETLSEQELEEYLLFDPM